MTAANSEGPAAKDGPVQGAGDAAEGLFTVACNKYPIAQCLRLEAGVDRSVVDIRRHGAEPSLIANPPICEKMRWKLFFTVVLREFYPFVFDDKDNAWGSNELPRPNSFQSFAFVTDRNVDHVGVSPTEFRAASVNDFPDESELISAAQLLEIDFPRGSDVRR
jgi:hypothetical protein